ncbi:MAG: PPC domain-containing DNA-binding protein [Actinomycetaceae bacterium]
MEYYTGPAPTATHVVRIDPGDDLLVSLREFIAQAGITNGAVVSGIGTLDHCRMHMVTTTGYPPVEVFPEWTDTALELVSMQGVIADGFPHIHMTVSTQDAAVSGHLEEGCRILYLCEVVVIELGGHSLTREPNEHGVPQLVAKGG